MGFCLAQGKTDWIVQTIPIVAFFTKMVIVAEE